MPAVRVIKAIWLNVLAIATLAGGVALFFVDPVRSWTERHGRVGWGAASGLLAVVLAVVNLWSDSRATAKEKAGAAVHSASERDAVVAESARLAAEVVRLERALAAQTEEFGEAQRALEELRHQPTERDKAMFDAIITAFPRSGRLYAWLKTAFSAKTWRAGELDLLHGVLQAISDHKMVDDQRLVDPIAQLEAAVDDLLTWMAHNGGGNDTVNREKQSTDPTWTYAAYDGNDLRRMGLGGWEEADRARDRGVSSARRLLDARDEFERIGRMCRL